MSIEVRTDIVLPHVVFTGTIRAGEVSGHCVNDVRLNGELVHRAMAANVEEGWVDLLLPRELWPADYDCRSGAPRPVERVHGKVEVTWKMDPAKWSMAE